MFRTTIVFQPVTDTQPSATVMGMGVTTIEELAVMVANLVNDKNIPLDDVQSIHVEFVGGHNRKSSYKRE